MLKCFARTYQFAVKIFYNFIKYPKQDLIAKEDAILEIPSIIKSNNLKKPLVVTDANLMKFGLLNGLFDELKNQNIEYAVFSDIVPNPTCENAENGYKVYKENNCDCLVAVGGGSPIDVAKVIGAKAVKPKKTAKKFLGLLKVGKKIPTLFAVPTTAGTGSEQTIAAVLIDEKENHKVPMADPHLYPRYAVLDPKLTVGLPPFLTATTGMDALCHAVESYTNHTYCTKFEDELSKKAIKLIYENIYEAYSNGANLEARMNMQLAATYAGRSFSRGSVGYVHAVGHTLSALYGMGHGHTMSILLPKVMRKFGKSAQKRLAEIAKYCGIEGENDEILSDKFITWIEEINAKMGIENKPKMLQEKDIPQIVEWAYKEAMPLYPCPQVWTKKDFKDFIESLL